VHEHQPLPGVSPGRPAGRLHRLQPSASPRASAGATDTKRADQVIGPARPDTAPLAQAPVTPNTPVTATTTGVANVPAAPAFDAVGALLGVNVFQRGLRTHRPRPARSLASRTCGPCVNGHTVNGTQGDRAGMVVTG